MDLALVTLSEDDKKFLVRLPDGRKREIRAGEALPLERSLAQQLCHLCDFRLCIGLEEAAEQLGCEPGQVPSSGPLTVLEPGKGSAILLSDLQRKPKTSRKKK